MESFTSMDISKSNMNKDSIKTHTVGRELINVTYQYIKDLILSFSDGLDKKWINVEQISNYINKSVKREMYSEDLYNYIADYCASKISYHPDYNKLSAKICIQILHKKTSDNFVEVVNQLYNNIDCDGKNSPLITDEIYNTVNNHSKKIQDQIDYSRDYLFDYFAIKTLERSYLYRIRYTRNNKGDIIKSNKIIERPQHMFMRVALGIHGNNLKKVFETYNLMSNKYFTHATPTLFNAGSVRPQMSSCFLLHMGDSIEDIFDTITDIAKISKWSGGIGLSLSDIRAKGSIIRKTNGISDGIIPLCRVLNMEAKYINQGGKRNGSITVYLEPWHADIVEFCDLRRNTEDESLKCRDLFVALWTNDLFMKRVKEDGVWSLMCPNECPGLTNSYGEEFEKLYISYEKQNKFNKQIKAIDLWYHILSCQIETGMPFMLFKDHANRKSNQKNLGTIKCSNLCTEILEYTDENTTSVCNLASLCLPRFIESIETDGTKRFNFDKLIEVTKVLVKNLDIVIDKNFYPTPKTFNSNSKHRPIGIGVQGLADTYNIMGYPFDSSEALNLNKLIFESIYYGSLLASNELAKELGPYSSFPGSPYSEGKMQFHLWGFKDSDLSGRYDWDLLCKNIKTYGLRNSLLTTIMPTATTSQIMGNSEAIDPYLSNAFTRSTLAGEFIVINENLVHDLIDLNIWSEDIRKKIIVMNGSISKINEIPSYIKNIYKTAFEIKMKVVMQQSVDRGIYIDQSQSLNLYMETSDFDRLTSAHFFGWHNGLKTGMYYLRSRPSVDPIQFGIEALDIQKIKEASEATMCKLRPGIKVSECNACS